MILLTIGLSLSFVIIGVISYLGYQKNKKLQNQLTKSNLALLALQKEFTQYQVDESRHDNIAKSIKKNEDFIYSVNKTLPEKIMKIVSQVEFAKPINKKTNI